MITSEVFVSQLTVVGMGGGDTGSAYAIFSFRMSSEVSRGCLAEVGVAGLSLWGPRGTEFFFCCGPPGVVGDSRFGVEVVGVAEPLLGGVVETFNEGMSGLGLVEGGGALVLRIATIRIISISPGEEKRKRESVKRDVEIDRDLAVYPTCWRYQKQWSHSSH